MRTEYERYAIYFAPRASSDLAIFGQTWLGSETPSKLVESPRRYGFHATLKAPIRLMPDATYQEFRGAVESLSFKLDVLELGKLKLARISNFLALTIDAEFHGGVSDLAWRCVTELDQFRAELTDVERRKRTNLSPDEAKHMEDWGYPYVGDRFRFHMTLTSALGRDELYDARERVERIIPNSSEVIDSICIFGDPGNLKPFELVERFDLKG